MRFSCERCGKRYATAEAPEPGRVYKIRCRACGHLILVKGAAAPGAARATLAPSAPAPALRSVRPSAPVPAPAAGAVAAIASAERSEPFPAPPAAEPAFFDPFADLAVADEPGEPIRDELLLTPAAVPLPAPTGRTPPPEALAPPAPRPYGRGPVVLIALGAVVLVGILAFVLLRGGEGARAPAPSPPAQPSRDQAGVPASPQGTAPPAPTASGGALPERPVAAERGAGRDRSRASASGERRVAAPRPRPEEPHAGAAAGGALPAAQIQKVLDRWRGAFQACIAGSRGSSRIDLDGRRITLRLNVLDNGAVTYPSIDDREVDGDELGACLKSRARMMMFPRFAGEALRVDVPLVLRDAG